MKVLVTGACGLVGAAVVEHLVGDGHDVIGTDLGTAKTQSTAKGILRRCTAMTGHVRMAWADLTHEHETSELLESERPDAVIHLAAVIPPFCYLRPGLARAVNVDATHHLVEACRQSNRAMRLVLASSVAVYGSRNPHRHDCDLTAETPRHPVDLYGGHKVLAEDVVTGSELDWVILRLGGVISAEQSLGVDPELLTFEAALPTDGRLQTVPVTDVARAFARAISTPHSQRIYLIGGDETHRLRQGELSQLTAAAMGMPGAIPRSRVGDPASDSDWFATDWMDTEESQRVLEFQTMTLREHLDQTSRHIGWRRHVLRIAAPITNHALRHRSPYRRHPGTYSDPWGVVSARWGEPGVDF